MLGILTYLANELTVGPDTIPYSTISAIGLLEDAGERGALIRLKMPIEDEIVLNTWAADRLNASTGDPLRLSYFHVGPKEKLEERVVALGVGGVVGWCDGSLAWWGAALRRASSKWGPPDGRKGLF